MRRLACAGLSVLALTACSRRPPPPLPEVSAELLSDIQVADPRGFVQLAGGFFQVEGNSWRWTTKKFTVVLRPPADGGQKGARLEFHFSLPDNLVERVGPVTLSATINGYPLSPESYSKPGEQVYRRDIPAEVLRADAVAVEFTSDKALPPEVDSREIAVVADRFALTEATLQK